MRASIFPDNDGAQPDSELATTTSQDNEGDSIIWESNSDETDIDSSGNSSNSANTVDSLPEDDPILSLSYLHKYAASSNVSERQNAIRTIIKTLQNVEHDDAAVQVVFSLIKRTFAEDAEAVVRGELMEQLPMLCMHCSQTPVASRYVKDVLFPLLVKLLNDPNAQVRKICQAAVLILIEQGLLLSDDVIDLVFPELMKLSGPCFPDDVRIEAVCLLCKLVATLGRENTIKLFLNKFTELCQDALFHVRKTCASHLGELSRILGQELTERLLVPHLISLSQDSVWGVRKTCAECFTDISYNCAMQTRRHQLAPVFIVLLADNSRWVQCSAFQALGPFISTFADSTRTGLKWVQGELVYDESTAACHPGRSSIPPLSSETTDQEAVLSNFLDASDSSSSAITSNIVQLAKQRLSGEFDSESSTCTVDLSALILPLEEIMSNADQSGGTGESKCDDLSPNKDEIPEVDSEYSSFRFWQSNYFIDDDDLLPALTSSLDSMSLQEGPVAGFESGCKYTEVNKKVDDADPNYQKFMERHLGVGGVASADTSVQEQQQSDQEPRKTWASLFGGESSSNAVENQEPAIQEGQEESGSVNAEKCPLSRRKSDAAHYVPFSVHNESPLAVSPKVFEYQDIIPQALLDQFLSMVEPSRAQAIESDISRHCAFNLPAVAFTIGRRHWPLIKPTYLALANDMQWKVRRTLAFSIHELAAILGPELTVQDLLPVFTGFLRDLDEVRIGILRHLYDFLKLLDKEVRRSLLPSLADFLQTDNYRSWRFRHLFAEQLILLCDLFDIEDINDYLSPIAMTLAIDKISEIRLVTHKLLAAILRYFYKVEAARSDATDITDSFIQDIVKGFAKSQRWVRRQTFVYVCREVIRLPAVPEEKFAKELLPALVCLIHDNIPNVRIMLASLFSDLHNINSGYLSDPDIMKQVDEIMKILANDHDRDVRVNAAAGNYSALKLEDILFNDQMDEMSFA